MRVHMTRPLFAWDCLDDSPSLRSVREFLACVPDGRLLEALRARRGRGRNDYRSHVLWGVVLLSIALRHTTTEACLAELRRNRALRRLIGIDSEWGVPKKWNMSRFMDVLGQEPSVSILREMFDVMVRRLGEVVPDLGEETAGDASHLSARRRRAKKPGAKSELPQADGGRKEYTDEKGNVTRVIEWFGYKFHLLVDKRHEVALAYRVTSTKTADCQALSDLVGQAQANLPEGRIKTLAYDRAADTEEVHAMLDREQIVPVIENRSLWSGEDERMLPGHDGRSNIVYDEAGTVYCYDKTSCKPVRHRMYYDGYEASRGTLKYRCPAKAEGWRCPSDRRCNGKRRFGKTVRVRREIDLRRFPPMLLCEAAVRCEARVPRATKKFERLHRARTAVERANARLKVFWGVDDGNITGPERFHGYLGVVMIVHAAMATLLASAPRRKGTLGKMRLSPIARALREKWRCEPLARAG